MDFSTPLKVLSFRKTPHEAVRNHFPDFAGLGITKQTIPTCEKINHTPGHHPKNAKKNQNHIP
jgi:hypothetical protein